MAYTKKELKTGDIITQSALDHYETGIFNAHTLIDAGSTTIQEVEDAVAAFNTALNTHISEDDSRWQSVSKLISDLRVELKQFVVNTYKGTTPVYDYSQTQTILMAGGLINLADQGTYTVPVNGAIQAQVAGLLGVSLILQINGSTVWTSPLSLLVPLSSPEIQVNAGDEVSFIGVVGLGQTLQVDYFPNMGT